VIPHQHRSGHVDVSRAVALEQVANVVRKIEIARHDPDVEIEPGSLLELRRMPLDARDIRIRIRAEEPDTHRRRA
jgi:hypothetical protein